MFLTINVSFNFLNLISILKPFYRYCTKPYFVKSFFLVLGLKQRFTLGISLQ